MGTGKTSAPRCFKASSKSGFDTPYSCTATRNPFTGRYSSSVEIRSTQVFGSGTVSVGWRPSAFRAATGFGPRTTRAVCLRAATIDDQG